MLLSIATPHNGYMVPEYVMSLILTVMDPFAEFEILQNECCYVHTSRNLMFGQCRGDYLLFVDSDMSWTSEDVKRLLRTEKDIVGGLYYKRGHPYGSVVYGHDGTQFVPLKQEQIKPRLFKCDGIGTGFLLIKRNVIDIFKENERLIDWGFAFDPIKADYPGNSGSYYMGEDLSFCAKVQHLGLEIWCDPETIVKHVGRHPISPYYCSQE